MSPTWSDKSAWIISKVRRYDEKQALEARIAHGAENESPCRDNRDMLIVVSKEKARYPSRTPRLLDSVGE